MSIFDLFKKRKKIYRPWAKYYTDEQLDVKIPNNTMYDQVALARDNYPNGIALEYFGKKFTYKWLVRKVDRCYLSFRKMGINKGDIVTLCMPNVPNVLIALYALNKIGAIANMLHPLSAEEEIKDSLNSTKSRAVVILDQVYNVAHNVIESTEVEKIIIVSAADYMPIAMKTGYKAIQLKNFKLIKKTVDRCKWFRFMWSSIFYKDRPGKKCGKNTSAVILHSGGTSGKPKNVVLSNRSFGLLSEQGIMVLKDLNVGDKSLAVMPNFHGFGLGVTMHCLLVKGMTVVLVPQFDAKKFDTLLAKTKPAFVVGVPTLFEALISANNEKDLDLSFVKYIVSGGDKLSKNLEDRVNEYLHKHNSDAIITQGYGLSEALAAVTLGSNIANKSGSVGIPLPGNIVKIIDPGTRETLPFGEIGEICIHTKALMTGYLNNESETNDALQIHNDGYVWLHTGDLGRMDEDGFLFIEGRSKRMIISSGYNVYPAHIEEIIEAHPAVLQCSVVGVPHPYKQEVPKAFIVLREGYHGLFVKAEIKNYCKKNLAKYMVPHDFVFRKQLPKTKLGKVDFRKLQEDHDEDDD